MAYGEEIVTKETISEPYSTLQDAFGATFEGLADSKERKFGKLRFTASPLFFAIMSRLRIGRVGFLTVDFVLTRRLVCCHCQRF